MTRSEFIEEVCSFYDLKDFCDNEGLSHTDDYVDRDDLDGWVDDDVRNCGWDWKDIRYALNDMPEDADFYLRSGYLEYQGCDAEDFENLKGDVLEYCDRYDRWDEEEYDEEEEEDYVDDEYVYEEPKVEDPNAGVSVDEFLVSA